MDLGCSEALGTSPGWQGLHTGSSGLSPALCSVSRQPRRANREPSVAQQEPWGSSPRVSANALLGSAGPLPPTRLCPPCPTLAAWVPLVASTGSLRESTRSSRCANIFCIWFFLGVWAGGVQRAARGSFT